MEDDPLGTRSRFSQPTMQSSSQSNSGAETGAAGPGTSGATAQSVSHRKATSSTLASLSSIFGVLQDKATSFSSATVPGRKSSSPQTDRPPEFDAIRWISLLKRVDATQPLETRLSHLKEFAEAIGLYKYARWSDSRFRLCFTRFRWIFLFSSYRTG